MVGLSHLNLELSMFAHQPGRVVHAGQHLLATERGKRFQHIVHAHIRVALTVATELSDLVLSESSTTAKGRDKRLYLTQRIIFGPFSADHAHWFIFQTYSYVIGIKVIRLTIHPRKRLWHSSGVEHDL
jgi:hypothetical protein